MGAERHILRRTYFLDHDKKDFRHAEPSSFGGKWLRQSLYAEGTPVAGKEILDASLSWNSKIGLVLAVGRRYPRRSLHNLADWLMKTQIFSGCGIRLPCTVTFGSAPLLA